LLILLISPIKTTYGQSSTPDLPVYIVQPGDTINLIALKFNTNSADLIAVNNISDPNFLQVNTQLLIPGISGISGILSYTPVNLGETPESIAKRNNIELSSLYKLNKITSPSEFFLGANIILAKDDDQTNLNSEMIMPSKITLQELAISSGVNTWQITQSNQKMYPWQILPKEILTGGNNSPSNSIAEFQFNGLPLTQGETASIIIDSANGTAKLIFIDKEIDFVENEGRLVAIFGVHALQEPGLYPFHLEYSDANHESKIIDQMVLVQSGFYPQDPVLYVDPTTLDESITLPEDELIFKVTSNITPDKYWDGKFIKPVDEPSCIKSWFGNRRSYNDQPYNKYHTGVDFGICANLNDYAPADGTIVYAGPLTIRGNATIIDHGLGVYSGFWHQENILVEVGQKIKAGDLIGEIGSTGRSTGPHLHWELIVNGIQVNPLSWLENDYP